MAIGKDRNPWGLKEYTKLRHKGLNNRVVVYEYDPCYQEWLLWNLSGYGSYETLDDSTMDEWEIIEGGYVS